MARYDASLALFEAARGWHSKAAHYRMSASCKQTKPLIHPFSALK
jgi:hypothetical protein